MALNKDRLKEAIKTAYLTAQDVDTDREDALEVFADNLSSAIVDEIKQLSITYTSGLLAGSANVTGTFNNTLS